MNSGVDVRHHVMSDPLPSQRRQAARQQKPAQRAQGRLKAKRPAHVATVVLLVLTYVRRREAAYAVFENYVYVDVD